ncbi:MAG: MATE family efflux transporter, partial [Veillonella nakazawae]
VSVAIIRPIITYLLCITFGLGLFGAWLSLCFDQSLRLCCSYIRFIRGAWQHKIV